MIQTNTPALLSLRPAPLARRARCRVLPQAQKKFGLPSLKFYKDKLGLFEAAPDFPSLARDVIKCDPKALKAAIDDYEIAIDRQIDLKVTHNTQRD